MARRSEGLGERPKKILKFLGEFQDKHGYSPSIREIGKHISVESTSLVDYYLNQLEEKGFIDRTDRVSRSIRILKSPVESESGVARAVRNVRETMEEMMKIPLVGRIGASLPVPMPPMEGGSFFDPESAVEISRSLLPRDKTNELFALEVDGVSMIDAMVNDGDIVIMKRANTANNGEMVAVWLEDTDETTLKYFYKEGSRVRLQPANPTMSPIFIDDPKRVRIQGKVVMVVRQFKQ